MPRSKGAGARPFWFRFNAAWATMLTRNLLNYNTVIGYPSFAPLRTHTDAVKPPSVMTKKDLLIQFLQEVTAESKDLLTIKVSAIIRATERENLNAAQLFYTEFNEADAQSALNEMRQHPAAIVEWLEWQFDQAILP